MTCREFGNAVGRLVRNGNLDVKTSTVFWQAADDVSPRMFPCGEAKWDGSRVVVQTSRNGRPRMLWELRNDLNNISYKYRLRFEDMPLTVNGVGVLDVEGNSVLDRCVMVI